MDSGSRSRRNETAAVRFKAGTTMILAECSASGSKIENMPGVEAQAVDDDDGEDVWKREWDPRVKMT